MYSPTARLTIYTLAAEIERELDDEQFSSLRHGKPASYREGCRGPLCRYANRKRFREIRKSKRPGETTRRPRKEQMFDEMLERILTNVEENADCPLRAKIFIMASIRREVADGPPQGEK